jgi:malate permease and related proteins
MIDSLFHAYTPLLIWPGIGFLLSRFLPERFPKLLGLALYWVGVPLQLIVLGHQTDLSGGGELIPLVSVGILLLSISLAILNWRGLQWLTRRKATEQSQRSWNFSLNTLLPNYHSLGRESLGSFILAAMLGNTGFVGLALTQVLFGAENSNWAILYSVTNNVIGTYGVAVLIASYFGRGETKNHWLIQLRDVLTVPSLWAFLLGFSTRSMELPPLLESGLNQAVWVVIASALLLVGLRLESMQGWRSLKLGLFPTLLKIVIVPALVGLGATYFGVTGNPRVVLVLMSGTPTGLSVLILAEVYNLDRELLTSTIAMTFVGLLLVLPLWLAWFG